MGRMRVYEVIVDGRYRLHVQHIYVVGMTELFHDLSLFWKRMFSIILIIV